MKPHLSPTQLLMHARCAAQYERRYLNKEIIPPGVAILKGTGLHGATKVNGEQKIESHQDLPVADIQEAAAAAFEAGAAGGYVLDQEEESRGAGVVLGEAKDQTVAMAKFYAEHQAPLYQPQLVERSVRIELPVCSHDLLGIIDMADDQDSVVDWKTSTRRKSQADADTSLQLTTYAAAFKAETGRPARDVRLETIVQGSKGCSRDLQVSRRNEEDFASLAHRINVVTQAIQSGIFPPTDPGNWWCSEQFCGYARTCPYFVKRKATSNGTGNQQA